MRFFHSLLTLLLLLALSASETQAQWVQTNGPYGGYITAFAVSSSATGNVSIFAGTNRNGVFISTNYGENWRQIDAGLTDTTILSLAVSAAILFAGTDNGVFYSTDYGANWMSGSSAWTAGAVNALAATPRGTGLLAGTAYGLYLSTDSGKSWTPMNSGLIDQYGNTPSVNSLAISSTDVFAGTDNGVYLSTDDGASWAQADSGLTDSFGDIPTTKCFAVLGTNILVGTGAGLFVSTDNARRWTPVNSGLPNANCFAVWSSDILAGTNEGVYVSTNSGASWTPLGSTSLAGNVYCLAVSHDATGRTDLFAGNDAGLGVFLSTNGGISWTPANQGLTYADVSALTTSPAAAGTTNIYAGTPVGSIFLSTDNGTSWTAAADSGFANQTTFLGQTFEETPVVNALALSADNLIVGTDADVGILYSTNDGAGWQDAWVPGGINVWCFARPLNSARPSPLYAGTNYGIIVSTDDGETWTLLGGVQPDGSLRLDGSVLSLVAYSDQNGDTTLFAGTLHDGVFRSTDAGLDWTQLNSGLTDTTVLSLAVSSNNNAATYLFAGTNHGVFLSTDRGASWGHANKGLIDSTVLSLAVLDGNVFAGTNGAVFLSTDSGGNWTNVSSGLPYVNVWSLVPSGTNLFAGTNYPGDALTGYGGNGVWRRPLSEMITAVRHSTDRLPNEFALAQNHPNPFNPTTTIDFSLKENSNVKLTIFNVLGQRVQEYDLGNMRAGIYRQTVDMSRFASGVYFYSIEATGSDGAEFVAMKKMALIK